LARSRIRVTVAHEADLPGVVELWRHMRDVVARMARLTPPPTLAAAQRLLADTELDPAARLVVARLDEQVVGMAHLSVQPFAPRHPGVAVHVDYLHVRPGNRRAGVGRALLGAAVAFADEVGAEHVVANVAPSLREANRFYARLGFGPVFVRRMVAVGVLRRRLASGPDASRSEMIRSRLARDRSAAAQPHRPAPESS
jgi:GNAT superfamily N-acetyltransferase